MIEINILSSVVLVLLFSIAVAGFGKLLLHLYDVRAGERHAQLGEALQREAGRLEELKQRVDAMSHRLPMEYVRREDWIRFSASIDTKLDRLAVLINQTLRGSK